MDLQRGYIAYIIPYECESYSLAVHGDQYYDVDASGHFCHVPVSIGIEDPYTNKLSIRTKKIIDNDQFTAIPFCIYKITGTEKLPTQLKIYSTTGFADNVISKHCSEWIGSKSEINIELPLSRNKDDNALQQDNMLFRISRPTFEYKTNSWFVAYKTSKFRPARAMSYQPLSYRIVDNVEVYHHGNNERYNFIKADEKMLPYQRILFYRKIDDVWDWLYCFKMLKAYYWASCMHPRPTMWSDDLAKQYGTKY